MRLMEAKVSARYMMLRGKYKVILVRTLFSNATVKNT